MNRKSYEEIFYYRDRNHEVDLIIGKGGTLRPIEIKRALTYSSVCAKWKHHCTGD
jgi:predicted AAA+ superfamily ATPase